MLVGSRIGRDTQPSNFMPSPREVLKQGGLSARRVETVQLMGVPTVIQFGSKDVTADSPARA
jgi:hypothetical protein